MERVTLQQWNDLMRHAGEDEQQRMRDARRAGGIEIVGLSTTKDAVSTLRFLIVVCDVDRFRVRASPLLSLSACI